MDCLDTISSHQLERQCAKVWVLDWIVPNGIIPVLFICSFQNTLIMLSERFLLNRS